MKKVKIVSVLSMMVFLSSCAVTVPYYQVYKAVPTNNVVKSENYLIYEDENCIVQYDFWKDGGNIGFVFTNKGDESIYLNMDESFFILNGIAHDYFRNRVYSQTQSSSSAASRSSSISRVQTGFNYSGILESVSGEEQGSVASLYSSGYSVSFRENEEICIPPKASKFISEYNINNSLYRNCDLYKYPLRQQVNTLTFTKENSPIVFSNRITYTLGESKTKVKFSNEFYVSEITNYPESEMVDRRYDRYCGQKSTVSAKYFKNVEPDKFYISYAKGMDNWRH